MRCHIFVVALLAATLSTGCQSMAPAAAPAADTSANDNLNAVAWVQTSAGYEALSLQAYRAAADTLDVALADPQWDALVPSERATPVTGLPPAVIMDIDETVLDNSPYQARLVVDGASYDEATWAQWVREQQAKALPGVVEFARAASERGVTIIYISNRDETLEAATLANLRAVGMPVAHDSVFLGLGTQVEGCQSHGHDKACRRQLAGRSYRVLMQFGDQLGDFVATADNTPAQRATLMDDYGDWFGERWWMLPNPTYGSWQPALFGNDWSQSETVRRKATLEALELAR